MRLDILSDDHFRAYTSVVKRAIRRGFGLHLKISPHSLQEVFDVWKPRVKCALEHPYDGAYDDAGNLIYAKALLILREQMGTLCMFIAMQPRLLRVTRVQHPADRLIGLREAFSHYPQQLFAIMVCGQMLRTVTFTLTGRELEITSEVMWRLMRLAVRSKKQLSVLLQVCDIIDPLPQNAV